MRPEFGCEIHDLVFDTIDAETVGRIETAINAALAPLGAEDRGDARSTSTCPATAEGVLEIIIGYRIRATNEEHNLVYPFYVIPAEETA